MGACRSASDDVVVVHVADVCRLRTVDDHGRRIVDTSVGHIESEQHAVGGGQLHDAVIQIVRTPEQIVRVDVYIKRAVKCAASVEHLQLSTVRRKLHYTIVRIITHKYTTETVHRQGRGTVQTV